MKYFKTWVLKNHPQLIENYPDGVVTLWEYCCSYHKEVIKEYRQDEHAIKTSEKEIATLTAALGVLSEELCARDECNDQRQNCDEGTDCSVCWEKYALEKAKEMTV